MSDFSVVGVLAEALAKHDGQGVYAMHDYDDFYDCSCGDWHSDIRSYDERKAAHLAHVASVVAALPNIAIIELPEPDAELGSWWDNDVTAVRGSGRVRLYLEDSRLVDSDARDLAAALLAASRRAARAAGGQA